MTPVLWQSSAGVRWTSIVTQQPATGNWTAPVPQLFGRVDSIIRDGAVLWAAGYIADCVCAEAAPRAVVWASSDGGQHWSALPNPRDVFNHGMFDITPCECPGASAISAMAVHDGVVAAVGSNF